MAFVSRSLQQAIEDSRSQPDHRTAVSGGAPVEVFEVLPMIGVQAWRHAQKSRHRLEAFKRARPLTGRHGRIVRRDFEPFVSELPYPLRVRRISERRTGEERALLFPWGGKWPDGFRRAQPELLQQRIKGRRVRNRRIVRIIKNSEREFSASGVLLNCHPVVLADSLGMKSVREGVIGMRPGCLRKPRGRGRKGQTASSGALRPKQRTSSDRYASTRHVTSRTGRVNCSHRHRQAFGPDTVVARFTFTAKMTEVEIVLSPSEFGPTV